MGGVVAGDPADQLLNRTGAGQALQIAHEGEATVSLATPTDLQAFGQHHPQTDRFALGREALELTGGLRFQSEIPQRLGQHDLVPQHRWQDGEMGHGVPSAFADPSGLDQAVQWPLPPAAAGTGPALRLGVMASGNGSNFEALVQACRDGMLAAEVTVLVVNNPGCGAVERADRLGVPVQVHDHRLYDSREALDRALIASFREAGVELVVMAGWMRIVTQELIDAYPERLINIHPSLLPSFRGARAIEQALDAGVRLTGCTAHLVSLEVDTGPILVQAAVPVDTADTPTSLAARIHAQEHRILPLAVQLAAERLSL